MLGVRAADTQSKHTSSRGDALRRPQVGNQRVPRSRFLTGSREPGALVAQHKVARRRPNPSQRFLALDVASYICRGNTVFEFVSLAVPSQGVSKAERGSQCDWSSQVRGDEDD